MQELAVIKPTREIGQDVGFDCLQSFERDAKSKFGDSDRLWVPGIVDIVHILGDLQTIISMHSNSYGRSMQAKKFVPNL